MRQPNGRSIGNPAKFTTALLLGLALLLWSGCRSSRPSGTEGVEAQDGGAASVSRVAAVTEPLSILEGIYTEEQALRGKQIFDRICIECHQPAQLKAARFLRRWSGKTVGVLFDTVSSTMPEKNPGSLTNEQYADVLTYVLQLNGAPAGSAEMAADSGRLGALSIQWPEIQNNIP